MAMRECWKRAKFLFQGDFVDEERAGRNENPSL